MKRLLTLIILVINTGVSLFAIEVADKKGGKLSIDTKILLETAFDFNDFNWLFKAPEIGFDLDGAFDDTIGFSASFDVTGAIKGDLTDLLEDTYLWLILPRDMELKIGQFKIPFGEESTIGGSKRLYPSHSLGSKEIAPGRDRGVQFSVDKLFGLVNLDVGVFNGLGTPYDKITLNNVLISSKESIKFEPTIWLQLEFGYGTFFEISEANIPAFELGQSLYGKIEFDLGEERNLFFLVEYMEKHLIRDVLNDNEGWTYDIFATAGFSFSQWDIFATFDIFRLNSIYNMPEDLIEATGGVNFNLTKDVRFSLFYEGEYYHNVNQYDHKVVSNVYIKL